MNQYKVIQKGRIRSRTVSILTQGKSKEKYTHKTDNYRLIFQNKLNETKKLIKNYERTTESRIRRRNEIIVEKEI